MIRKVFGSLILLAASSLGPAGASAQVTHGSMMTSCAEVANEAARLACFDALAKAAAATQRGPIPAFLFEWQTMVAGILALAAAIASVVMIRRQIQVAKDQEGERLKRRQAAARSTLPLTLTEIVAFSRQCADELQKVRSLPEEEGHLAQSTMNAFSPPEVSPDLIVGLERMIEASPEGAIRDTLADIIDRLQVVGARLSDVRPGQTLNSANFRDYVVDAVTSPH